MWVLWNEQKPIAWKSVYLFYKMMWWQISEGTKNQTASNVMGRFCGRNTPQVLNSQLDQVYVHFISDHMIEHTGYRLEWAVSGQTFNTQLDYYQFIKH